MSHVSMLRDYFLADATALVRGSASIRQFNSGSPRTILTNVSWTSEGNLMVVADENVSREQSYDISCRYC